MFRFWEKIMRSFQTAVAWTWSGLHEKTGASHGGFCAAASAAGSGRSAPRGGFRRLRKMSVRFSRSVLRSPARRTCST